MFELIYWALLRRGGHVRAGVASLATLFGSIIFAAYNGFIAHIVGAEARRMETATPLGVEFLFAIAPMLLAYGLSKRVKRPQGLVRWTACVALVLATIVQVWHRLGPIYPVVSSAFLWLGTLTSRDVNFGKN